MIKKLFFGPILLVLLVAAAANAEVKVADAVITTAIKNQMPVDKVTTYSAGFGKLFCFSRIVGATKDTKVTHVWYYKDDELARVELPVGSSDWRTYSSKRFLPQWTGPWKVVILAEDGHELASVPFVLE